VTVPAAPSSPPPAGRAQVAVPAPAGPPAPPGTGRRRLAWIAAAVAVVALAGAVAYTVSWLGRDRRAEVAKELSGHSGVVTAVAFSPDGTTLASSGADGTVRLWNVATGKAIGEPIQTDGEAYAVAFSPDGRIVASAGASGHVQLWNAATRSAWSLESVASPAYPVPAKPIRGLSFNQEGRQIAAAAGDGSVQLWSVSTGLVTGQPLVGHDTGVEGLVRSVAFSPTETKLLVSAGNDDAVRFWDLGSVTAMTPLLGSGHSAPVHSVAFSPDGKALATGGEDRRIRIWPVAERQRLTSTLLLTGHTAAVTGLSFSPDGRTLASGSDDKTVRLWAAATGDPLGDPLTGTGGNVTAVAFHPKDGTMLATAGADHVVRLWRITGS
jgi:WD40 repeat protein